MDTVPAPRRFPTGAIIEWLVASAFLCGSLAVASLIVHELSGPATVVAEAPPPDAPPSVPPSVPAGSVSVPILPFLDGKEVRIGDTASAVAASLGRSAENGRQEIDRGTLGERLTRFYEYAGVKFILVYEPFDREGEVRVAGIYLP